MDKFSDQIRNFIKQRHVGAHLIDRIKWHLFPKFFIVAPFPTHIDIEVSGRCQLNCPMCARNSMIAADGLMDFELYRHIVDQARKLRCYS